MLSNRRPHTDSELQKAGATTTPSCNNPQTLYSQIANLPVKTESFERLESALMLWALGPQHLKLGGDI